MNSLTKLTRKAPQGAWPSASLGLILLCAFVASEDGFGPSSAGRSARWPEAVFRVLKGKHLLLYATDIDAKRIHVREPFGVVLLCGGPYGDIDDPVPKSLRDAFLKTFPINPLKNKILLQAEDITSEHDFHDSYDDILIFETDLAQIVELIILFCESEGSLAELGAFSVIDEIMKRLFVIVREKYWTQPSFIKLGPLKRIEREVGRAAIQVVADHDVGLEINSAKNVDKKKLEGILECSLAERLKKPHEPTTFDQMRAGHVIKLIVGLVQEYGALTRQEIQWLIDSLGVQKSEQQIRGYLRCAMAVNWLIVISKGANDYYVPTKESIEKGQDAATLHMKEGAQELNKSRRRTAIREYWMENDKLRFAAIQQSGSGHV